MHSSYIAKAEFSLTSRASSHSGLRGWLANYMGGARLSNVIHSSLEFRFLNFEFRFSLRKLCSYGGSGSCGRRVPFYPLPSAASLRAAAGCTDGRARPERQHRQRNV